MNTSPDAIENWIVEVFRVCGIQTPPSHLVNHYKLQLTSGAMRYEMVQQEILELSRANQQPQQPATTFSNEDKQRIRDQIGEPKEEDSQANKIKQYVDQLYLTFTGKKGHPSNTNYLISSLTSKTLTPLQAEYHVKFSKEAKEYEKKKKVNEEMDKRDKLTQYVTELYRVYVKNLHPTQEEIAQFLDPLLTGETTLQSVEDEFRLMSLASPPKKM
eukprot:TRINITY_DN13488_c0_g1_i1.p1 TRINITY_DN13488_c0_g1~~TRINITY_DN13488_c0_g1_i1.p1  ORF type:complete len:215 (-),score=56.20 TRINITY_DN13488_c0_g1_i1:34-678(-)